MSEPRAPEKARFRITFGGGAALRDAIDRELEKGVVLVKVEAPSELEYGQPVALEIVVGSERRTLQAEVVSLLGSVGVAVSVSAAPLGELRQLAAAAEGGDEVVHEIVRDEPAPVRPVATGKASVAERIRLALHGTRDDRAALLRDPDRSLHGIVLKSPKVTIDEIATWARSPQSSADLLKAIGDRKEWLAQPSVAKGLVRNPKAPPDVALRALEHVGTEMLRQIAKGQAGSVSPVVTAAAKKKVMSR